MDIHGYYDGLIDIHGCWTLRQAHWHSWMLVITTGSLTSMDVGYYDGLIDIHGCWILRRTHWYPWMLDIMTGSLTSMDVEYYDGLIDILSTECQGSLTNNNKNNNDDNNNKYMRVHIWDIRTGTLISIVTGLPMSDLVRVQPGKH
jgi:hypothetical protein